MQITYLGHSCFLLRANDNKTVVTDPYTGVGYELPTGICADTVTVSHGHFDHAYIDGVNAKTVVNGAGVSVANGVEFIGVQTAHDEVGGVKRGKNTVFLFTLDGMKICHLGDIGEPCSERIINSLGQVDVLMIPVGGNYTIDCKEAKAYMKAIQSKLTLLMHYRPADGTIDIADKQTVLSAFEDCVLCENGVLQVNEQTQGIILMERTVC